ncbi:uncharacterized protein METZ01_LOCUS451791, partial [marine metagenome]
FFNRFSQYVSKKIQKKNNKKNISNYQCICPNNQMRILWRLLVAYPFRSHRRKSQIDSHNLRILPAVEASDN